ncbi:hypothetical protein BWI97_05370 [Siphonobacter sp. BAB-5405]|uniref:sensor histidine kinase n=1 Tax=Siphonobacter sp. BAB-5405 TaxID=1864825 RepID=UPI000C7FF153|nr:HAMP domain-containing sensor histidine kinase [Siphonobacter sp. BAB-5405]PMD98117.1 hypothetical protein BWI97_05370 [Siphonobacter sp. BAB-5405]
MAINQYSKRFITKIKKVYVVALPILLVLTILFNNLVIDFYYKVIYRNRFKAQAEEVVSYVELTGSFPKTEGVSYRPLPPDTKPYSYFEYHFFDVVTVDSDFWSILFFNQHLNNKRIKEFTTTAKIKNRWYELKITKIELNEPGGPENEAVWFAVAFSLILFFLLNWGFFQFNLNRVSYNLWRPFYQNLRRINSYHIRNKEPLQLKDTHIREFELFNQAILDFTTKTQSAYNQLREFTENTAHELQTPLSILLAKVELILKRTSLESENRKELLDIKKTIVRLSGIHKGLNLLSRIRSIQYAGNIEKKEINLNELVRESLETYEELIEYRNLTVTLQADTPVLLSTNEELVRILVDNLLRNAVQHNVNQGEITISLTSRGFEMSNTGSVVEGRTEDLFARYHTKSTDNGRLGLGLAIVEAICETLDFHCAYAYQHSQHVIRIHWQK